jgi:endonuclease VIII
MEGPSLVILKEETNQFAGRTVLKVEGNSKIDQSRLLHQPVTGFKSWGKHFLICFPGFAVRIHFLMFGSYRVNEKKEAPPRLSFQFENGEFNLYSCAVKIIEEPLDEVYDWSVDVMSEEWDRKKAMRMLKKQPDALVCDALLDQNLFAGVGNIIKNEVLFRIFLHPESRVGALKPKQLAQLTDAAREYSFDFYAWKKIYQLKKHWLVYNKRTCPRCKIPITKKHTGTTNRRSFYCEQCQRLLVVK